MKAKFVSLAAAALLAGATSALAVQQPSPDTASDKSPQAQSGPKMGQGVVARGAPAEQSESPVDQTQSQSMQTEPHPDTGPDAG